MIFTLGLHKLPFTPDSRQIIYVAGEHDEKVTELVKRHFCSIREHFQSEGYTFCYIPYVKQDLLSKDRLHYNVPFAKSAREADYMVNDNFILDFMVHPENREKVTPALLYYDPDFWESSYTDAEDQLRGISISEASFAKSHDLREVLEEILSDIRQCRLESKSSGSGLRFREEDEDSGVTLVAEENFDSESQVLIQEIEERIEKLRQKGIDSYLIEKMFSSRKTKLSRMHITKDYRIYLGDYFGMEIEMTPLQKAVYFLFLRHPEGIPFKWLADYRQELSDIYNRLKPSFESTASKRSIEAITSPTNNSINEKCSQIRAAFISKFDEHLAENYFITGSRGEPKGIKLPRKFVKCDPEIADLLREPDKENKG